MIVESGTGSGFVAHTKERHERLLADPRYAASWDATLQAVRARGAVGVPNQLAADWVELEKWVDAFAPRIWLRTQEQCGSRLVSEPTPIAVVSRYHAAQALLAERFAQANGVVDPVALAAAVAGDVTGELGWLDDLWDQPCLSAEHFVRPEMFRNNWPTPEGMLALLYVVGHEQKHELDAQSRHAHPTQVAPDLDLEQVTWAQADAPELDAGWFACMREGPAQVVARGVVLDLAPGLRVDEAAAQEYLAGWDRFHARQRARTGGSPLNRAYGVGEERVRLLLEAAGHRAPLVWQSIQLGHRFPVLWPRPDEDPEATVARLTCLTRGARPRPAPPSTAARPMSAPGRAAPAAPPSTMAVQSRRRRRSGPAA